MDIIKRLEQTPTDWRLLEQERVLLCVTEGVCRLMEERGVSNADLASVCGVAGQTMRYWLSGRKMLTTNNIVDMAFHLGARVRITFEKET